MRIRAAGLVTSVGLTLPAAAAAVRARISRYVPVPFHDLDGTPIVGAPVPRVADGTLGVGHLARMLAVAVQEALGQESDLDPGRIALLLGLSEPARAGRPADLEVEMLPALQQETGRNFHRRSRLYSLGRAAGLAALTDVPDILRDESVDACLVAGVDSFLNARDLEAFDRARRLKTEANSDGFIPAESAAAILIARRARRDETRWVEILGVAATSESATVESGKPSRADGMTDAARRALKAAGAELRDVDLRLCDASGERYGLVEQVHTEARLMRERSAMQPLWHPCDCLGEIGAAAGPALLALALQAFRKGYLPGSRCLVLGSSDGGLRAAAVVGLGGERSRG